MGRTIVIAGTFILIAGGAGYIAYLAIEGDGPEDGARSVERRVEQMRVNEAKAVALLRTLTVAQAQIQASGRIDEDGDGYGEFAGVRELTGVTKGRMKEPVKPALLEEIWQKALDDGSVFIAGYRFRVFLPGPENKAIAEPQAGFVKKTVNAAKAESRWCCYAWPDRYGKSGRRSFFVDEHGEVLVAPSARYSGDETQPQVGAAFLQQEGRTIEEFGDELALQSAGHDGHHWRPFISQE